MNKISIIIPAYNSENRISKCLDSIITQSYDNLEIIVVDDGSTDNTKSIVAEYSQKDSRIKYFSKENSGVSPTRLFGIDKATGDWIGFIDSDDHIDNNMYEILINNAIEQDSDISHCGYQMNFESGETSFFYNTNNFKVQNNHEGVVDLLEGRFVEPGLCNKLYKTALIKNILERLREFSDIRINEDLLFNYFLFKDSKKSVFFDCCPYHYFKPESKASNTGRILTENIIFDPIKVRKIIYDDSPESYNQIAHKSYINSCITSCNTIVLNGFNTHKTEFNEIKTLLKSEKNNFSIIGTKRSVMAHMIISMPHIYSLLYKMIFKLFKKR